MKEKWNKKKLVNFLAGWAFGSLALCARWVGITAGGGIFIMCLQLFSFGKAARIIQLEWTGFVFFPSKHLTSLLDPLVWANIQLIVPGFFTHAFLSNNFKHKFPKLSFWNTWHLLHTRTHAHTHTHARFCTGCRINMAAESVFGKSTIQTCYHNPLYVSKKTINSAHTHAHCIVPSTVLLQGREGEIRSASTQQSPPPSPRH